MFEKLVENTFVEVALTGNIAKVAAGRGVSSWTVARRIKQYEKSTGSVLFTGTCGRVNYHHLTWHGRQLLKELTNECESNSMGAI